MQSLANIIRMGTARRKRGAGIVACARIKAHGLVVEKTEGKGPSERHTRRWTIILERM
jgi:hypothetical protein